MHKQVVTHENWDGKPTQSTLYFNLTRMELMENMGIKDRSEALYDMLKGVDGEKRELMVSEIQQVLDLVKEVVRISYGVREDDDQFVKSEAVWTRFKQSSVYDAFMFGLFEEPERVRTLLTAIIPPSMIQSVNQELQAQPTLDVSEPKPTLDIPGPKPTPAPAPKSPFDGMSEAEMRAQLERMVAEKQNPFGQPNIQ